MQKRYNNNSRCNNRNNNIIHQQQHCICVSRENRLPLTVRVKDPHNDPIARISFYKEGRVGKGEASPAPICNLNLALPRDISPEHTYNDNDIMAIQVS